MSAPEMSAHHTLMGFVSLTNQYLGRCTDSLEKISWSGKFATRFTAIVLLLFCAVVYPACSQEKTSVQENQNVDDGRKVANEYCAFCHVVAQGQPTKFWPARGASFHSIARRTSMTSETMKEFLKNRHQDVYPPFGMPNLKLEESKIIQVVAYLFSLRDPLAGTYDGWKLANQRCARCHVVVFDQVYTGIFPYPAASFPSIARRPTTTADSIRNFLLNTHRDQYNPMGMPNQNLSSDEMNQLSAYLLSLSDW